MTCLEQQYFGTWTVVSDPTHSGQLAGGLCLIFGAFPILFLAMHLFPRCSDLCYDGQVDVGGDELFGIVAVV